MDSESELHRPKNIQLFFDPEPAQPDYDEWSTLQELVQRKHIVRFSTREARQYKSCNR